MNLSRRSFLGALVGLAVGGRKIADVLVDAVRCPALPPIGGVLTLQMIEDAVIHAQSNFGTPNILLVSPQVFEAWQRCSW